VFPGIHLRRNIPVANGKYNDVQPAMKYLRNTLADFKSEEGREGGRVWAEKRKNSRKCALQKQCSAHVLYSMIF
jgi:hypothetical protein